MPTITDYKNALKTIDNCLKLSIAAQRAGDQAEFDRVTELAAQALAIAADYKNAAAIMGSSTSDKKSVSSAANGRKGGRPVKPETLARRRISEMSFTAEEEDFIFSDWPNWDEHITWLNTASREEIADWIIAAK